MDKQSKRSIYVMKKYGPGVDETGKVNHKLSARGVSFGKPPKGLRNWDCRIDGHEDPDNTGLCIHCYCWTRRHKYHQQ